MGRSGPCRTLLYKSIPLIQISANHEGRFRQPIEGLFYWLLVGMAYFQYSL